MFCHAVAHSPYFASGELICWVPSQRRAHSHDYSEDGQEYQVFHALGLADILLHVYFASIKP
jgi:hypothetical protein